MAFVKEQYGQENRSKGVEVGFPPSLIMSLVLSSHALSFVTNSCELIWCFVTLEKENREPTARSAAVQEGDFFQERNEEVEPPTE